MIQFLPLADVQARTGARAKSTIWLWQKRLSFPRPVKVGGKALFIAAEVDQWLADQVAKRDDQLAIEAGRAAARGARQ